MTSGWRLASLAIVFSMLFGVLGLRLWFLQVTGVDEAVQVASQQQFRTVSIPAPRGDIFDRNGVKLAGTTAALRIIVDRSLVPADGDEELISSLAALLDTPALQIADEFESHGPGARFAVGGEVSESLAVFTLEHIEDYPGVSVEPRPVRVYPAGESAAHVIGYIGAPGEADLRRPDIGPMDEVGKFGVERQYDGLLRGTPGRIIYRVNAAGEIIGVVESVSPVPGGNVILTLDIEVQAQLEDALMQGINLARIEGEPVERASGVVLDPRDGSVLAMASVPSFDPTLFVDGQISEDEWADLSENAKLNNFAIQGLYPPASAFKVVAYSLALEQGIVPQADERFAGLLDPDDPTSYFCDGQLDFRFNDGSPQIYTDWLDGGHGEIDVSEAFHQSCDLYFWGIALEIWNDAGNLYDEAELQEWARQLGFGSHTGIDLPFELDGLVADREWFETQQLENPGRVRDTRWAGGDIMSIAIGQGLVTATPLQLGNAYAGLLNGGTLWRPRVVDSITDAANVEIFTNPPNAIRSLGVSPRTVELLKADMQGVTNPAGRGTARSAFEGFGDSVLEVGGKTGTAEIKIGETDEEDIDTAWFVGAAPLSDPEFLVVVVVDQGGSGGRIAAPTARAVLQYLMGEEVDPVRSGQEAD